MQCFVGLCYCFVAMFCYYSKVLLDKSRVFSMEKGSAQLESETAAVVQQNRYAKWTAVEMRKELKTRGVKGLDCYRLLCCSLFARVMERCFILF